MTDQKLVQKQPSDLLKGSWTLEEKKKLAIVIGHVFDMQKQFGKNASQLDNVIQGFLWVLSGFPVEKVIYGFGEYIKRKSDMPTPSDIVAIIDPKPPEWVPDKPYYVRLQKIREEQGPFGLNNEEIEYIAQYENNVLRAGRK